VKNYEDVYLNLLLPSGAPTTPRAGAASTQEVDLKLKHKQQYMGVTGIKAAAGMTVQSVHADSHLPETPATTSSWQPLRITPSPSFIQYVQAPSRVRSCLGQQWGDCQPPSWFDLGQQYIHAKIYMRHVRKLLIIAAGVLS
jgi:hypothetical protein